MDIIATASLVLSIAALVYLIIGALLGIKRGLLHSLLRLGTVVLTAGLSLGLTFALRNTASGLFETLVDKLFEEGAGAELIEKSPTLAALVSDLPTALAGPFIFLALFLFLNGIFYIIYKILKKITAFEKKLFKKFHLGRVLGALVSCLAGCLILICVIVPFSGYIALADDVVSELSQVEGLDEEITEGLVSVEEDYIKPLASNAVVKATNLFGSKIIFEPLTSCSIDGERVSIKKEAVYVANTYATVTPLINVNFDFTQFGETEAAAMRKFAADFDSSVLIPHVIAEIIPLAANAWVENSDFLGVPDPTEAVPEDLQELMGHLLIIMQTTTHETLKSDLTTIVELIAILSESGTMSAFSESTGAKDIVNTLSKPGLISGLIDVLYENERTRILVADLANLGFNAIGDSLEIPKTDEEIRAQLTADLNEAIKNAEQLEGYDNQVNDLALSIKQIFVKYGMEAGAEEARLYAECIIGTGPIAADDPTAEVEEYFHIISAALAENGAVQNLSALPVNPKVSAAITRYLEHHGTDGIQSVLNVSNQLNGSTEVVHEMITLQRILLSHDEINHMTHEAFLKQAKALEDVIILLGAVIVEDEEGNITLDALNLNTQALSAALHDLADTRTDLDGNEIHNFATALTNLIKFALQRAGIDAAAACNLVDHILSSEPDENGNRKDTLSTAFVIVDFLSKKDATMDDMKEGISSLVQNLDGESAKILADCVSSNLINNFGGDALGSERTDALVNVTHDLLENFGEHAEELSPEQLEAEATYMQTIFELSMSAGEVKADDLFTTDENGEATLGQTATEFVDAITHSTIISETMIEHKEDMKTAINDKMSDNDKEVLADALLSDSTLSEELKDALKYAFGLEGFDGLAQ